VANVKIDYVKGSNIIGLEPRRMDDVFPAVNVIEGYWTALAAQWGPDPVPPRSRIDPRGIDSALANAFILERMAPGVGRFRLAGSHLADLMGMEVRGMPLSALFLPDARDTAAQTLERAFSAPARVTLLLSGERGIGRPPLDARMVLLPLRDEEGQVTRILGGLEAKGNVGRQPRRFTVVEERLADLGTGTRAARPNPAMPRPGFAEPVAPALLTPADPRPGPRPGPRRPALRVIRNDAG
jgi:hypothetical protein